MELNGETDKEFKEKAARMTKTLANLVLKLFLKSRYISSL
jgi:hypothetical protein